MLQLPGVGGASVSVHPVLFHAVLDQLPVAAWQVRQEAEGLRILIAGAEGAEPGTIVSALKERLARAGVAALAGRRTAARARRASRAANVSACSTPP